MSLQLAAHMTRERRQEALMPLLSLLSREIRLRSEERVSYRDFPFQCVLDDSPLLRRCRIFYQQKVSGCSLRTLCS